MSLTLTACVPVPGAGSDGAPTLRQPLQVVRQGAPYGYHEGRIARQQAEALCAQDGKKLVPSIYDRFAAGAWIYVEGCR